MDPAGKADKQCRNQQGNKLSARIYKALIILICGVILLSILEGMHLLKSSHCYIHEGDYNAADQNHERTFKFQNSKVFLKGSLSISKNINRNQPVAMPTSATVASTSSPVLTATMESSLEDSSETDNETSEENRKETQSDRQLLLRDFCRHKGLIKQKRSQMHHLLYSDKQGVIYCSVPKAACTNWKRIFQVFEGHIKDPMDIKKKQSVHKQNYSHLLSLNNDEAMWRKNAYYSFMFVRHPFERLLSAFRNKFLDPYNSIFQRRYGSRILRFTRRGLSEKEYSKGKNITFEEFVNYLVFLHEHYGDKYFDEHWQIIHTLCHPCSTKYNFVGKMETLVEDAAEVLKQLGLDKQVKFPVNATDKYKLKVDNLMKEYYSKLPSSTINKLYDIYEADFTSFGYAVPDFL